MPTATAMGAQAATTAAAPMKFTLGAFESKIDHLPPHFLEAIKSYLTVELRQRGLIADDGSALKVNVTPNYYRMRGGVSRAMLGVLAGKDGVKSNVQVVDASGNRIAESDVSSYNVLAVGSEEDIARMHAKEIADFLQNKAK
jgi:hypothetical protein